MRCAKAAMAPAPLTTEDGDSYDLYVADQESYDSNLYRLPTGTNAVGTVLVPNATKEDYYNTASVGADGQRILGRQVVDLDLRIDENRFVHNTVLDNTAYTGHLLWNWRLGGYLSGQAGADYSHALAGFDETRYLGRDLVDDEHYFGIARYQIGPRWAIYGSLADSDITHSAVTARFADFRNEYGGGGIEYATDVNTTFALQYNYIDGRYPYNSLNSLNGFLFSPDFHDQLTQFLVKYSLSDKTQLSGNVGYIKREYGDTTFGSFSGVQWRVGMNWQLTEKTSLTFAGWHELHAYLISEADYFVSKGASVAPLWSPTEKIQVSLLYSYESQSFIPQSFNVLTIGPLEAKVQTATAGLAYLPAPHWTLQAGINYQKRDANQALYTFDDNRATIGVLYKIH